jgi:hypothetical protein
MNFYAVRLFDGKQWNIIRTYGTYSEAKSFAELLTAEWDIKEVSMEEASA